MEQFIYYFTLYLPAITSVAATIISILVSIRRVKQAIGDNKSSNVDLKKALAQAQAENSDLAKSLNESVGKIQAALIEKEKEIKVLAEQNKELKETFEQVSKLVDECETLKNQASYIINKGE